MQGIHAGWEVYGRDGDKVGDVVRGSLNYLRVSRGVLGADEIFVPSSAIDKIEGRRVRLNVATDQIEHLGWDQRPGEAPPHER